jgi:hypothetical protein
MNTILKRIILGILAACLLSGAAAAALAIREEVTEESLIADLQHGGYVVYLRHAQRYKGAPEQLYPDSPPAAFADCAQQRNLTPYGIEQATLLREQLRRARVTVRPGAGATRVPTRDTAMLAFGRRQARHRLFSPATCGASLPPAAAGHRYGAGGRREFAAPDHRLSDRSGGDGDLPAGRPWRQHAGRPAPPGRLVRRLGRNAFLAGEPPGLHNGDGDRSRRMQDPDWLARSSDAIKRMYGIGDRSAKAIGYRRAARSIR